jgi:hypothetical protein
MGERNDEGETREEVNREANKIGRRVRDVIADGDVLDRGLGLWNVPSFQVLGLSTPLALEQRATGQVRSAFPDQCSCITQSRIGLDPMAPVRRGICYCLECSLHVINYLWVGRC